MIDITLRNPDTAAEPDWPGEPSDRSEEAWRVAIAGARGGQGTTTVATALAVLAAGHADTALVATRPDDVHASPRPTP